MVGRGECNTLVSKLGVKILQKRGLIDREKGTGKKCIKIPMGVSTVDVFLPWIVLFRDSSHLGLLFLSPIINHLGVQQSVYNWLERWRYSFFLQSLPVDCLAMQPINYSLQME